jgi:L-fuculose-phosphate aldolase
VTSPNDNQWLEERQAVLDCAKAIYQEGLVVGTSGNVSARCGKDLLAVTATSVPYDAMTLDDIVVVDFTGEPIVGEALPSTESLMHIAIYEARPDVGAVCHTHSAHASGLSVANQPLVPMIDEMVVHMGGRIEVSEYAFPGTEELGERVVEALGDRAAALVRNHGVVGVGKTVSEAHRVCQMVEHSARIYTVAKSIGQVHELPEDSVRTEIEIYRMKHRAEEHA